MKSFVSVIAGAVLGVTGLCHADDYNTPKRVQTVRIPITASWPPLASPAPSPAPASEERAALPPSIQPAEPARPKPSRSIVIAGDNGGVLGDYIAKYRALGADGATFRIDGRCVSACTIVLAFSDGVCVTKRAVLGFHESRDKNGRPSQSATDWVMARYPAPVREYISAVACRRPKT